MSLPVERKSDGYLLAVVFVLQEKWLAYLNIFISGYIAFDSPLRFDLSQPLLVQMTFSAADTDKRRLLKTKDKKTVMTKVPQF